MAKLIVGFLLGVAAATAFFYLTDSAGNGADNSPPAASAETVVAGNRSAATPESGPTSAGTDPGADPASAEETTAAPIEAASGYPEATGLPAAMIDPTTATGPRRIEPSPGPAAPERQYPPEIADMIEKRVNKELHSRYEADPREESWATYMEGQLAQYFGSKPRLAQFNFSLIDCRTTICEVHVLGYGSEALTQWNIATADFVSQPWHDFRSMSMNRFNPQPDVLAIVLIVTRDAN